MAVTLSPGSSQGSINGVTAVEIVPAPAAGTSRAVRSIRMVNKDTAIVTIRIRKLVAGTPTEFDNVVGLVVDGKFDPLDGDDMMFLTATNQSITAVMALAPATTQPTFVSSWIDRTVT